MAVGGPTAPQIPAPLTPAAPSRAPDATREAQRAFFQAALTGVAAPAPAEPAATPAPSAAPAPVSKTADRPAQAEPGKGYRPGSLLDIRI